jgi:hypothetical protein
MGDLAICFGSLAQIVALSMPTTTLDCKRTWSGFFVCRLSWSNLARFAIPIFGRPSKRPKYSFMSSLDVGSAESGFSETLRLFHDRFHYTRDGERETGEYGRMPVIGQENPRPKQRVMSLSALAHHGGQALEFEFLNHSPVRQEPSGDEEESVE